ncbi:Hsp70 family protein [Planosporangium thailandense]|uniref:Hsp70 family protein n=1 Tax=Planosporangium thailandense TaxID=765197 RepID=A0ABX0XSM7_9ACTN|nr:Hsp70 family protein [Planosporangium thailandense]NJC69006.1 Hsp70 family protein [Planosporangium thailandense]
MAYVLGIDIGDTCTAAAICRHVGPSWSAPEVVALGAHSSVVPSALYVSATGSLTVGDPGRDGPLVDGGRITRGFMRRIGDETPLVVAGESCTPQTLAAVLAMWVVEQAVAREGADPEHLVVTHPPSWGTYRKQLLHEALWEIGLTGVTLLAGPVTAAENHSFHGFAGRTLAVYALGGNSVTSSVVRRTQPAGFEVVACQEAVEPLGGVDFDEMLTDQLVAVLAEQLGAAQLDDPRVRLALFGLRNECRRAKERLSTSMETEISVHLPQGPVRLPVTRAAFEELIRPALRPTVDRLDRTIRSCGLRPDQVDGVLLVGGSARIPLVADLVSAHFPGQVTVAADPQVAVAAGAALAACQILALASRPRPVAQWRPRPAPIEYQADDRLPAPHEGPGRGDHEQPAPPSRPPVKITPLTLPKMRSAPRLVAGRRVKTLSS